MPNFEVKYDIIYGAGGISHRSTVLTLNSPSESEALYVLRRQGAVQTSDNVVIIGIKPR